MINSFTHYLKTTIEFGNVKTLVSIPPTMYTFYFHGHYTTVASVCTAYFPNLRKGKGDESRRNRHSNQKNKKTSKKVLTKGEGFGILTKLSAR